MDGWAAGGGGEAGVWAIRLSGGVFQAFRCVCSPCNFFCSFVCCCGCGVTFALVVPAAVSPGNVIGRVRKTKDTHTQHPPLSPHLKKKIKEHYTNSTTAPPRPPPPSPPLAPPTKTALRSMHDSPFERVCLGVGWKVWGKGVNRWWRGSCISLKGGGGGGRKKGGWKGRRSVLHVCFVTIFEETFFFVFASSFFLFCLHPSKGGREGREGVERFVFDCRKKSGGV